MSGPARAANGGRPAKPAGWAWAILWAMMLAYALFFSAVAIRLHDAQHTHKADLGQIDLAIWNTGQGRFVQEIKGDQVSTRLTDHVEPIFAPVSLVFLAWNDVRALLILQSVAVALGAWPVFLLAYGRLGKRGIRRPPPLEGGEPQARNVGQAAGSGARPGGWLAANGLALAALAFALAYLLYPALQAALVAEFHALPLATPLILLAFLFAQRRQWGRFAAAALLVATVQEGMALLAAMLGVYALGLGLVERSRWGRVAEEPQEASAVEQHRPRAALLAGLLVLVAGLAWFYVATFRIIPAHAAAVYGLEETPYAARFGALGDSFGDVLRTILTRPGLVLSVAMEPLRLAYLLKLLAPVGFLALAGPEILLLALPLLLANLLSAFPFQYSGELHYSAPLAAYALFAAIVGAGRLRLQTRQSAAVLHSRRMLRVTRTYLPLVIWLLVWSIGTQIANGYTPIGSQFQYYRPSVGEHQRLLARFQAQIPADAPLSTMATLYPHLSHREHIYEFPALADSQYVLLDVAASSGWSMHPEDMRNQVQSLLASGRWAVQDAADGYLLLHRDTAAASAVQTLPPEFLTFAQPDGEPQFPLNITFEPPGAGRSRLELLGYDVIDDPKWRQTAFRFYWQALAPLPDDLKLQVVFVTPDGREVDSTGQRPLIQPLWYPPAAWPVGETQVTDKLPWFLPVQWAPAIGAYTGDGWDDRGARWQVVDAGGRPTFDDGTWAQLAPWQRQDGDLDTPPAPVPFETVEETFGGDGWTVQLSGVSDLQRAAPGASVPLVLRWQADTPAPRDYTIFVHLRDTEGRTLTQADAEPTWYGKQPTSQWPPGEAVLSAHELDLPPDLPPGVYEVVVGWYYWENGERLARLNQTGLPVGDGAVVARLEVDSTSGKRPDLACAVVPEACASR